MTTATLTEIRLDGVLGKKFGKVHHFVVCSIGEAVAALNEMLPGFEAELMRTTQTSVRYACFYGKENISDTQLLTPSKGRPIKISPVLAGSKKGGLLQLVMGAALIVASFYTAGLAGTAGISAATAAKIGTAAFAMGSSMALGAAVQLFSPVQKGLSTKDGPDNGASYNMNGAVQTTAQGNPHPVLYGECWAGSAVVSAGIYNEDQL